MKLLMTNDETIKTVRILGEYYLGTATLLTPLVVFTSA